MHREKYRQGWCWRMWNELEYLESLPEIDILQEEGITLEGIMEEMREDFEAAYEEAVGEERILYPADPYRLLINVVAGQLYQAYQFSQERFKENFIRYMDDDLLLHWGANLGYQIPEARPAVTELEFGLNEPVAFDVTIPAGTRVTAGDDVYFASDEEVVIPAGALSVTAQATCLDAGTAGNGYAASQLSTMVDSVPYVSWVANGTASSGGTDAPSGDALREAVYLFPSTYSAAGPEDAYIALTKEYSSEIADVSVVTDERANVNIYVLLKDGKLPEQDYLDRLEKYLKDMKRTPDTDHVILKAPDTVPYEIEATYYISSGNKDMESAIRENVKEAVDYYVACQCGEIGMDIDSGALVELARVAGAKRVSVSAPEYVKLSKSQIAACTKVKLEYGGLED